MKGFPLLPVLLLSVGALAPHPAAARTIWNGPRITFTKSGGANPSQAQNQDRITDAVWITRDGLRGIYNIAQEGGYTSSSPAGTQWAFGTTADIDSLTFRTWFTWHGGNPPGAVGRDAVLHLVAEDIYIDIRFISWGMGAAGGGAFSYSRSTPPADVAPSFTQQPQSATVDFGANASFTVAVAGSPAPTLQWRKDGQPLAGETGTTLSLTAVTLADAGAYTCAATNTAGTATSNAANLAVNPPPAPSIQAQPEAMTSLAGSGAFFSVQASGADLAFQWRKGGVDLAGATGATLFLGNVQAGDAGDYSCRVSNPGGEVTTTAAGLTVASTGSARLANLSARAQVGTGADILIPGIVIAGGTSKTLLVRAVGPRLGMAPFNVGGVLADPTMTVFSGGSEVGANDDWMAAPNQAGLAAATLALGAFSLDPSTKDAALLVDLAAGPYTVQARGVGEITGVALVELFDGEPASAPGRLVNLSARARVGTGGDILIPGIVIEGDVALTLLIRGVGPTLGLPPFNVGGVLADPVMTLFRGGTALAVNDDWEGAPNQPALVAATAQTGAFALGAGQKDAAFLVALNPGAYTVQMAGKNGGIGVGLIEVYLVGP